MRVQTHTRVRRDDILESARVLFSLRPYDKVSLDEIIAHSRTSKGSVYHHFESKEDLYASMLEGMMERLWRHICLPSTLHTMTAQSFWPTIAVSWRRSILYLLAHPEEMSLWRGFQDGWRALPDSGPARRLRERTLQIGVTLVTHGQRLGCVRRDLTPMQCAEIVDAVDSVTDRWFFDLVDVAGATRALEHQGPQSLDLIWRLLVPAPLVSEGVGLDA